MPSLERGEREHAEGHLSSVSGIDCTLSEVRWWLWGDHPEVLSCLRRLYEGRR